MTTQVNPQLSLGVYDGCFSQLGFNFKKWIPELLSETKVNRISFHLNGEFLNPDHVYMLNPDLSINEAFMDHLDEGIDVCTENGMAMEVKMISQYFESAPQHPYRTHITAQQLYTNHRGKNSTDKKQYYWLWYVSDDDDNVIKWAPANAFGEKMIAGFLRVIGLFGKYEKMRPGKTKIWECAYNEASEKLGDDNRVHSWFRQMFWDAGFQKTRNVQFAAVNNPTGTTTTASLNAGFKWSRDHGYMFEIHSVDDHMNIIGNKNLMVASTDGVKDSEVSKVVENCRTAGFTNRDAKFSAVWCDNFQPGDMNVCFEKAMPFISKLKL